jgi:hypothetical protein
MERRTSFLTLDAEGHRPHNARHRSQKLHRPPRPRHHGSNAQPWFLLRGFHRLIPRFLVSPTSMDVRSETALLTRGPQQEGNYPRGCGILVPASSLVAVAGIPRLIDDYTQPRT